MKALKLIMVGARYRARNRNWHEVRQFVLTKLQYELELGLGPNVPIDVEKLATRITNYIKTLDTEDDFSDIKNMWLELVWKYVF